MNIFNIYIRESIIIIENIQHSDPADLPLASRTAYIDGCVKGSYNIPGEGGLLCDHVGSWQ